jgi:hypothetical protein
VCLYHAHLARHLQVDDALIAWRYLRNALAGHGLVYNLNERWNALSSPLYTGVSVLAALVAGDIPGSQLWMGATCLWLTAVVVMSLVAEASSPVDGLVAGLLIVSNPLFYRTIGLETPLFLLLLSLTIRLEQTGRRTGAAATLGLLTVTRGEGLLLAPVLLAGRGRCVQPRGVALVVFALPLAAQLVFASLYYGAALPPTLSAKAAQGRSGLWGPSPVFLHAGYLLRRFLPLHPAALALLLGLGALALLRWRREPLVRIVTTYALLYSAFYVVLDLPNYHWYYAVPAHGVTVLAACGLGVVREGSARWFPAGARWGRAVAAGLAATLAIGLVGGQLAAARSLQGTGPSEPYRQIGLWLARHTPSSSRIACVEVGTIGWYSDRQIIDVLGLVTPGNAGLLGRRDFAGWLRRADPDFVLVHDPPTNKESWVGALHAQGRRPIEAFPFPGYALFGAAAR